MKGASFHWAFLLTSICWRKYRYFLWFLSCFFIKKFETKKKTFKWRTWLIQNIFSVISEIHCCFFFLEKHIVFFFLSFFYLFIFFFLRRDCHVISIIFIDTCAMLIWAKYYLFFIFFILIKILKSSQNLFLCDFSAPQLIHIVGTQGVEKMSQSSVFQSLCLNIVKNFFHWLRETPQMT